MKNKIIAGLVVVSFLLVGVVSADLLPWFGQISGSATVEAPVFYAVSGAGSDGEPGLLSINEFEGHGATYTLSGGDTIYFKTEELESIDFYAPKLNLSVEASLKAGTQPNLLDLTFGYYDTYTQGTEYSFCNSTINVTSEESKIYSGVCEGSSTDKLEAFYYSIHNKGTRDVEIKVKTYGNTKAEVLGVAE